MIKASPSSAPPPRAAPSGSRPSPHSSNFVIPFSNRSALEAARRAPTLSLAFTKAIFLQRKSLSIRSSLVIRQQIAFKRYRRDVGCRLR